MNDEVLNPVDIERAIREVARRIHEGVKVVTNADAKAREADRLHEVAVARAYMQHEGPRTRRSTPTFLPPRWSVRRSTWRRWSLSTPTAQQGRWLRSYAPSSLSGRRCVPCTGASNEPPDSGDDQPQVEALVPGA